MEFLPQFNDERYIVYKLKQEGGKLAKYPADYRTGLFPVNAHAKKYHTNLTTAAQYASIFGESYGIGYSITAPYVFIDIDHCINSHGHYTELARKLLKLLRGAYVEISASKTGLHIIGTYEGELPKHRSRRSDMGLEVYTDARFVALTGTNAIGDCNHNITDALLSVINEYLADNTSIPEAVLTSSYAIDISDENLIAKALSSQGAKSKAYFADLWFADETKLSEAYPSSDGGYDRSLADAALAQHLAFWTGNDSIRIKRLMLASSLARDKYHRILNSSTGVDYLDHTIANACKRQTIFYSGSTELMKPNATEPAKEGELIRGQLQAYEYPDTKLVGKSVRVLNTIDNLKYMLGTKQVKLRYNIMTGERETFIPGFTPFFDDLQNSALSHLISMAEYNGFPSHKIDMYLTSIAQEDPYHPIVECLRTTPWDGKPRLDDFTHTIQSDDMVWSSTLIERWMMAAISAAHSAEGFATQGVLVLVGEQYKGKTSWIKQLDPIGCNAVKEGAILDPRDKDCLLQLRRFWIVELGELDSTFRRADIARIKAYITSDKDEARAAYAPKSQRWGRRTVYAASVNDPKYLVDTTGNRRWWTINLESIYLDHGLNMQQVWAEAYTRWGNGARTNLTIEEIRKLNDFNRHFEQIDPLEDLVMATYNFEEEGRYLRQTPTDVLRRVGYLKPSLGEAKRMGSLLAKLLNTKPQRGRSGSYFLLPSFKDTLG